MKFLTKFFWPIFLAASISCGSSTVSHQQSPNSNHSPSPPQEKVEFQQKPADTEKNPGININGIFTQDDTLSYGDYTVERLNKKVRVEQTDGLTEVSYAVLKRKGKVLAKFDGVYSGVGNATEFGLFSFLGNENRQLIVSQTVPRTGRHWIVDLSPDFRVVYDSSDYAVGREDLHVLDIDKDGKNEILQEDTAFYGFENLYGAEAPLPWVIFKYDEKAGKYLPANHLFKEYALENIKSGIDGPASENSGSKLSDLIYITLHYIYAGEEQKGWEFFDKEYKNADREDVKTKAKAILTKHPVYKFIYGKNVTK